MRFVRYFTEQIKNDMMEILRKVKRDHVSAYAAQSSFFLMLSMIPMILLLLNLVQYTPVNKADILKAAYELFPTSVRTTIVLIIDEVYAQSKALLPLTAFIAMWSAGRGTLAVSNGLNCVYEQAETRIYIYLRARAAVYTVLLLLAVILCLLVLGLGRSISPAAYIGLIILFSNMAYIFLPNHKKKWKSQLPGSVFTAFGWMIASFIFSVYMDVFQGFSDMYGSLTTIVLIMLWLYFCMYVLLIGGELNVYLEQRRTKDGFWKTY